jgi:hypothetical protein
LAIVYCLLDIEAHLAFFFGHAVAAAVHLNSLNVVVKIAKMPYFPIETKNRRPVLWLC